MSYIVHGVTKSWTQLSNLHCKGAAQGCKPARDPGRWLIDWNVTCLEVGVTAFKPLFFFN